MEYQRLGEHIREVNVRNRDLAVTRLVGLTIDKAFIPSVANVIGTDLSNYKVIRREQFACSLMQVSRDGKIPVAMFKEDEAIMSPAYPMFEVIDTSVLMPQYLMMWFSRSEFDREASYYAVGGVRGSLTWEDFCNMRLPVPSIERQREIVAEYQTLTDRINLNQQMIQKLEATAQSLYQKTFVTNIDKENLPPGWKMGRLGEICDSTLGGDWGKDMSIGNYVAEVYCIRGADIPNISKGMKYSMPTRFVLEKNLRDRRLKSGDIVIEISGGSPTQSTGRNVLITNDLLAYANKYMICSNFCRLIRTRTDYEVFFYASLQNLYANDVLFKFENSSNGVKNLDLAAVLNDEALAIPSNNAAKAFAENYIPLFKRIYLIGQEVETIKELQSLLLAKMGQ